MENMHYEKFLETQFDPSGPSEMLNLTTLSAPQQGLVALSLAITEVIILIKSSITHTQKKWQMPSLLTLFFYLYTHV